MADKTKNWKALQGAAKIKRRLHLKKDKDGVYPCPVSECDHEGFRSERGCRKHIQTIHPWFYYFDKYPSDVVCEKGKDQEDSLVNGNSSQLNSNGAVCEDIAFSEDFIRWMCSCSGEGRTEVHANQISSRALKFLRYCLSENPTDRLTSENIDYYLGPMEFLANFLDHITKDENQAMGILVHDAIGKYVHPTRYRQIIETESTDVLDAEERDIVSQDQKHTSNVAKIHYRKKRSRDVAERGNDCLKKLRGEQGRSMDKSLETLATSYETEGNLDTEDIHTAHTALLDKETEQNGVVAQGVCSSTRSRNPKIPKSGAKSVTDCMVLFSAFEDNQLLKGIKKHA
eukprot:Seg165.8 transcript_id=Seg165.8/GoldUCD/mRNA.D3Y31 product="hypothetical protein" protein_id=Seg165.8/GoldUCD/D3Y31